MIRDLCVIYCSGKPDFQPHRVCFTGICASIPIAARSKGRIASYGKSRRLNIGRPGTVPHDVDRQLRNAIAARRQIRFFYKGKERIAEPHDYGIQKGFVRLLTYQVGGESNTGKLPAWRLIDVGGISQLEILPQSFPGNRLPASGSHRQWDALFIRVSSEPE